MSTAVPTNTPTTEWWPRLGFVMVGGLDNVVTVYDKAVLLHFADALESDKAHRTPAAMSAASILRHLAETPAAVKVMNHHRPLVPRDILGMNRAVHYFVRHELFGKDKALDIASIWNVAEGTIEADRDDFRKVARTTIDKLVADTADHGRPRAAVLADIDADMEYRAKRMRKA